MVESPEKEEGEDHGDVDAVVQVSAPVPGHKVGDNDHRNCALKPEPRDTAGAAGAAGAAVAAVAAVDR